MFFADCDVDGTQAQPLAVNDVALRPAEVGELEVDHEPGMFDGDAADGKGRVRFGPQANYGVEVVFRLGEQIDVGPEKNGFNGDIAVGLLKDTQGLETEPFEDVQPEKKVTGHPVGDEIIEFVFQRGSVSGRKVGAADDTAGCSPRSQKTHVL